jgi:hypothetical protein
MARLLIPAAMTCCLLLTFSAAAETEEKQPAPVDQATIARLIADLADDDVRWNAHRAMWRLRKIGSAAEEQLEAALFSHDWQQRQIAAHCLRGLEGYEPSDRMLEVTVEGLRDDDLPSEGRRDHRGAYTYVFNAKSGTEYLLGHAEAAGPFLLDGLRSDDAQQRFLSAFILGHAGLTSGLPEGAPILLEHLRDNDIGGDAIMSAAALYRFGPDVMPHLLAALPDADAQQAQLVNLILLDLTDPPENEQELRARKSMQNVTSVCYDPVLEFDLDRQDFWF